MFSGHAAHEAFAFAVKGRGRIIPVGTQQLDRAVAEGGVALENLVDVSRSALPDRIAKRSLRLARLIAANDLRPERNDLVKRYCAHTRILSLVCSLRYALTLRMRTLTALTERLSVAAISASVRPSSQ